MSLNPYEAPRSDLDSIASTSAPFGDVVFYRTNTARLTLAEFRRLSPNNFVFLVGVLFKLLRINGPATFAFGAARHEPHLTSDQFSEAVNEKLRGAAADAVACGLRFLCAYRLPSIGTVDSGALAYANDDGSILAPMAHVRVWHGQVVNEQTVFSFQSRLSDGRVVTTVGAAQQLNSPPEFLVEHLPGRTYGDVLARHQARLAEFAGSVMRAPTPAEQIARLHAYESRSIEFQRERGVYVAATPQQLEFYERLAQNSSPPGPSRSTAFQGLEFLFLLTIGAALFGFWRMPTAPRMLQVVLVGSIVSVTGLVAIHLYRMVVNRRNRSK